jgi:hypothetical protein
MASRGGGRGRGRGQLTFNMEAVGIGKGDALPPPTLQPSPLFPVSVSLPFPSLPCEPPLSHMSTESSWPISSHLHLDSVYSRTCPTGGVFPARKCLSSLFIPSTLQLSECPPPSSGLPNLTENTGFYLGERPFKVLLQRSRLTTVPLSPWSSTQCLCRQERRGSMSWH